MDFRTELALTPIQSFNKFSVQDEYIYWNFIADNHNTHPYEVQALSEPLYQHKITKDILNEVKRLFGIKIYESKTSESVDFLLNLGFKSSQIYSRGFLPQFIGFKKGSLVAGTLLNTKCYCENGIIETIYLTQPELFNNLSELGIEEKDLE